jgi:hypothetical protein
MDGVCVFAHLEDEKPRWKDEKMVTCVHGKTLTVPTARLALKLPKLKGDLPLEQ